MLQVATKVLKKAEVTLLHHLCPGRVAQWSAQQRLTGVQKVAGSIPSVTQKFSVKNFLVGEFEAEC